MSKANKKTVHPLFKYHPVRYALMRESFLGRAIETLNEDCPNRLSTVFATETQKAYKTVSDGIRSHIDTSKSKDVYPSCLQLAYKQLKQHLMLNENSVPAGAFDLLKTIDDFEFQVFKEYTSFINSGSNIFEFPKELLNVFWETDINDVSLEDIYIPFTAIYLHFGKQDGKKLYGTVESMQEESKVIEHPFGQKCVDFFLDGAYVSKCPKSGTINIILTSIRNSPNYFSDNCIDDYEEVVNYKLTVSESGITVEDALKYELEDLERQLKKIYNQKQTENFMNPEVLESALKSSESYTNTSLIQFTDCLKLIINCLLYLQSYPDEIEDTYPDSALKNLVAQTKTKTFIAGTAARKLSDLGYRKIKFCGRNSQLIQQINLEEGEEILVAENSISLGGVSRTVSPHKRRTHRRKQRYGKGLESWRYIWIKETTIHPQKYQPNQEFYRIYEVVS